jgi:hypothetical protein
LIFAGLVVLWLLILVPAVARRRQEVERPSAAALAGRVLARPVRHRSLEVAMDTDDERDELDTATGTAVGTAAARRVPQARAADEDADDPAPDPDEAGHADVDRAGDPEEGYAASGYYAYGEDGSGDVPRYEPRASREEDRWERPPASFRRGRGGFDAEAAALAARARYTFRQRVVIALLVAAVVTALAGILVLPALWWVHGLVDLGLVGYLGYLRRQVRMEEAIRARRAARMAGTRRAAAGDDPDLDDWAHRGRDVGRAEDVEDDDFAADVEDGVADPTDDHIDDHTDEDWTAQDGGAERVRGTGEPVGVLPAHRRTVDGTGAGELESALPRLQPAPAPPLPAGTQLVDVDEEEDDIPEAGVGPARGYRRAAGE